MPTWHTNCILGKLKLMWQIKIILNKFISNLNNATSAFKLKKKTKINFLILKEKRKENLDKNEQA